MKQIGLMILFALSMHSSYTQEQNSYNPYVGQYGYTDGLCLFEDGRFLLYGYATAVFGRYTVHNDDISFYPDEWDLFDVYGNNNSQIKGNTSRWQFIGFEDGDTFAQFDQDSIHRVFNTDANCFIAPFFTDQAHVNNFILLDQGLETFTYEVFHFTNTARYNDFVLVYNKMARQHQNFSGRLEDNVIKLSNYGGEEGYPKLDEVDWEEVLYWKAQYDKVIAENKNSYTDHYTQLDYHKLNHHKHTRQQSAEFPVATSAIFHVVCDDSFDYSYDDNTESDPSVPSPFSTDKLDGLYWVKALDRDVYMNTILEEQAVLTVADIRDAHADITPHGIPVITINLTADGQEKLHVFTRDHIGQFMALVINKTVLSIPYIAEEIAGGSMQISANFTLEEAQAIADRLNTVK